MLVPLGVQKGEDRVTPKLSGDLPRGGERGEPSDKVVEGVPSLKPMIGRRRPQWG